ncbi:DUF7689 domain-containing protein [Roseateles sp.]|uniref:DUF7689 domain-containing protein n=1 Tax=Roseateles sp. TaxID=1971397 RepID=UPI002F40D7BC
MAGGALITIEAKIRQGFHRAVVGDLEITSDRDPKYNCIAWAMGEDERYWWPDQDGYWPDGVERSVTVQAFIEAFATKGFVPCAGPDPIAGKEIVALYTLNGSPTHAAFLHHSGKWASKLGAQWDIHHKDLPCIGGNTGARYGDATHYFQRDLPPVSRPVKSNAEYAMNKLAGWTNSDLPPEIAPKKPVRAVKQRPIRGKKK